MNLLGLQVETVPTEVTSTHFELSLRIADAEDGLRAALDYRTDLFDRPTIELMAAQFGKLLDSRSLKESVSRSKHFPEVCPKEALSKTCELKLFYRHRSEFWNCQKNLRFTVIR